MLPSISSLTSFDLAKYSRKSMIDQYV
jgi:hypothetical protein